MLKLIHPKTGTVREVAKTNQNKIKILRRAGFVDFATYKPKKKPKVVVDPTLAEEVEDQKLDAVDQTDVADPVTAIHVSAAARKLIADNDLDAESITGTGKDGQIVKPDVVAHLESLEKEPVVREATKEEEAEEKVLAETEGGLEEEEVDVSHDSDSAMDADGNLYPPSPDEEIAE